MKACAWIHHKSRLMIWMMWYWAGWLKRRGCFIRWSWKGWKDSYAAPSPQKWPTPSNIELDLSVQFPKFYHFYTGCIPPVLRAWLKFFGIWKSNSLIYSTAKKNPQWNFECDLSIPIWYRIEQVGFHWIGFGCSCSNTSPPMIVASCSWASASPLLAALR